MHGSGFVSLTIDVATRLNFVDPSGKGYVFPAVEGDVAGTITPGDASRDFNWERHGRGDAIRDIWDAIRTSGITTKVEVGTSVDSIMEAVSFGINILEIVNLSTNRRN